MSFLMAERTEVLEEGVVSELLCVDDDDWEVASETRKLRSKVICCSMCWMAYCSHDRQYFRHFIDSSLTTAAVVPAAELAWTTSCCQVLLLVEVGSGAFGGGCDSLEYGALRCDAWWWRSRGCV